MTNDQLRALIDLAGKATPGPWSSDSYRTVIAVRGDETKEIATTRRALHDADYIVAACNAAADLARELLASREQVRQLEARIDLTTPMRVPDDSRDI